MATSKGKEGNEPIKMKALREVWEMELFINGEWQSKRVYFDTIKSKEDLDIQDLKGVRRNAKFIGFRPNLSRRKP